MNFGRIRQSLSTQHSFKETALTAVFFGALSAVPFNLPWLFALCWVSFGAVFALIQNSNNRRVFTTLLCFFIPFYMVAYFWFTNLYPLDFAGLNAFQSVLVILCAIILIPAIHAFLMSACIYLCVKLTKAKGLALCFVFSFAYCFGEYLQSIGPLAFPWARIFVSQIKMLPMLQSASLFGSYFITFIVVLCNCLLAQGFLCQASKCRKGAYIVTALLIFTLNFSFGQVRLLFFQNADKYVTAVALQGNMSSYEKWSGGVTNKALDIYKDLFCKALDEPQETQDTRIFLTPETAFPLTLCRNGQYNTSQISVNSALLEMSRNSKAYFVAGAFSQHNANNYNCLFLYSCDMSEPLEFYQKKHLVPFGEYLPYRNAFQVLLPFLTDLNMFGNELSEPCISNTLCDIDGIKTGGIICFDSVFSDVSREQVRAGARLLLLSTNDSWYKTSVALKQHLAHAQMRAIENGVSVIRSANTGISANILPTGKIADSLAAQKRGYVKSRLPIQKDNTLYTYIGDAVVFAGIAFVVLYALFNNHCWRKCFKKHIRQKE